MQEGAKALPKIYLEKDQEACHTAVVIKDLPLRVHTSTRSLPEPITRGPPESPEQMALPLAPLVHRVESITEDHQVLLHSWLEITCNDASRLSGFGLGGPV